LFFLLKKIIFVKNRVKMSAATLSIVKTSPVKRYITLEKFLDRYTNREDPYKYEWHKGIVEKKSRTMNRNQFLIIRALQNLFDKTLAKKQSGLITTEVDMYLPTVERTRRTDLAFLPSKLIEESRDGLPSICPFVIEVISKNDKINEVEEKIIEYFDNGVQVVWVIFPKVKKVEVYTSIRDVKICFGEDICTATPVMPDFTISVNDILG
jgi:Uma2 family endonuclease